MSFSAMYVNKEIETLTPYKYLDSLDSARFKEFDTALINGAQLHAYADFFLTLLMGEGIVVPNNQLIDSLPFLDVASQLIQHAKKTNNLHILSLRASLFNSTNPYEVAAKQFGNIGTDEKGKDRFVLSGWPYLDEDYPRRTKWKERLALGQPIPTTPDFTRTPEIPIVEQLNIVLEYFNSPDGKRNITSARSNKQVRIDEIHQVANLGQKELEELLSDLNPKNAQILQDTILVINQLIKDIKDIDVRSNIVSALVLSGTPAKLNPVYFEKTAHPVETHKSVISIIDSIYNYAAGFGVNANLISHTARASAQDAESPSFYALALWARLTSKTEKNFVLNTPNGLIVPSGLQWNKILQRRRTMEFIAREKFPWGVIFEATTEPTWRISLNSYLKALHDYHTCAPSNLMDAEKKYLDERLRHLDQSKRRIPQNYWDIRKDEIRIEIEDLQKQIEEEHSRTDEVGSETSDAQRREGGTTAAIEAKIGAEISPLAPKLTSEIGGKVEGTLSIANERQQKQSRAFQNTVVVKSNRHVQLRLAELEKLYEQKDPYISAIKGVIAAIEDTLV